MRARFIKTVRRVARLRASLASALALVLALSGGCFSGDEGGQFYGRVAVPRAQEFRWSDGGLPRVFDPARAAAPPDTDAVRALYDGLTDYDPRTLAPVSADAERWESSKDNRVWTFYLRRDARWSNGDSVTAEDYLRSWQRTLDLGDDAPHADLLSNLTEAAERSRSPRDAREPRDASAQHDTADARDSRQTRDERGPRNTSSGSENSGAAKDFGREASGAQAVAQSGEQTGEAKNGAARPAGAGEAANQTQRESRARAGEPRLAVDVIDEHTLRVRLREPDPNLPSLLAHTIFRPVHAPALDEQIGPREPPAPKPTRTGETDAHAPLVTNGAFRLSESSDEGVVLERAPGYRDASSVALDKVRFVNERDAESALRAYRAGEIDAVTNANLGPAAAKLLASYQDFERDTFGAITYYDFNSARPPFDDVRVRAAFALAVDRKRLSEDTLGGSTVPAEKFLPTQDRAGVGDQAEGNVKPGEEGGAQDEGGDKRAEVGGKQDDADKDGGRVESPRGLIYDPERARLLLAEAGYPGGYGFPRVRLLVNRNEQHSKVAEAVADMWRAVLGVETEIEAKGWDEYETKLRAGEYDVAKRSLIMQTPDEEQNVAAMFPRDRFVFGVEEVAAVSAPASPTPRQSAAAPSIARERERPPAALAPELLTEADALKEVPSIPIYFASAFSLVKPYVRGFDANLLGVYSLKRVSINARWKPPSEGARPAASPTR